MKKALYPLLLLIGIAASLFVLYRVYQEGYDILKEIAYVVFISSLTALLIYITNKFTQYLGGRKFVGYWGKFTFTGLEYQITNIYARANSVYHTDLNRIVEFTLSTNRHPSTIEVSRLMLNLDGSGHGKFLVKTDTHQDRVGLYPMKIFDAVLDYELAKSPILRILDGQGVEQYILRKVPKSEEKAFVNYVNSEFASSTPPRDPDSEFQQWLKANTEEE